MNVHRHLRSRVLQLTLLLSLLCPCIASAVGRPYLVKNINPNSNGIESTLDRSIATLGTSLIFAANDGTTGQELWKSDGTEAGTQLVADIRPGLSWSSPANMTTIGTNVFFSADDGVNGTELWVTDGTAGGTRLLKDIYQGSSGSNPARLVAFNGRLFFTAASAEYGTELWTSDGTPEGTVLFREFTGGTGGSTFGSLDVINGSLLISVYRGTSWELWTSDGTAEGTLLVRSGFYAQPDYLTPCNGTIFFRGSVAGSGAELWQTDGTDSGTLMVKDINAGIGSSYPANLACVVTTLFFAATEPAAGTELWKSDGTEAGTVLVKDINSGASGSSPDHLTALNGRLLFSAYTPGTGGELWQSDGTPEGTTLLADITPGPVYSSPAPRFVADGRLFFSANNQLWLTDGTLAGTFQLSDDTSPANFTRIGDTLFFSAYGGSDGNELRAVTLERTPFTRITAPQSGTAVSTAQVTISGEAHGDGGASVTLTEVSVDGGTSWYPATGSAAWSYTWSPPGDGTYTVMARSTDSGARVETVPAIATVTVDTLPPTATLAINGSAPFTPYRTVILSLTASATEAGLDCSGQAICGTLSARFSNDGATWGSWQTASPSTQWDLGSVNGLRTVYAQVRDRAGNIAQTSATITMDTTVVPEVNIAQPLDRSVLTSVYPSLSVTVSGTAADHSGTGLSRMEISLDRVTWNTVDSGTIAWIHRLTNLTNGVYTVYLRAVDNSGYISPIRSRQFLVDVTPITGYVAINNGAASTGSSQVTLTLGSVDPWGAGMVCVQVFPPPFGCEPKALYMRFSTDNVTWSGSYPFATTMPWNLGNSNTIYVQYTNQHGVSSPVYSDSIILTTSPLSAILQPTANTFTHQGTVTASGSATASAGNSVTLVEVSTNNGATWQAAAGTDSWSYSWTPATDGVYQLRSHAQPEASVERTSQSPDVLPELASWEEPSPPVETPHLSADPVLDNSAAELAAVEFVTAGPVWVADEAEIEPHESALPLHQQMQQEAMVSEMLASQAAASPTVSAETSFQSWRTAEPLQSDQHQPAAETSGFDEAAILSEFESSPPPAPVEPPEIQGVDPGLARSSPDFPADFMTAREAQPGAEPASAPELADYAADAVSEPLPQITLPRVTEVPVDPARIARIVDDVLERLKPELIAAVTRELEKKDQ